MCKIKVEAINQWTIEEPTRFFRVLSIRWLIEYRGCIHDIHAQLFWEQQLIKSKKKTRENWYKMCTNWFEYSFIFLCE